MWNGLDKCDNLLLCYEQGIGDNFQYYRFVIELSRLYPEMKITYFCKDIVAHIFKEYDNIHVIKEVQDQHENGYHLFNRVLQIIYKQMILL